MGFDPRRWRPAPGSRPVTANLDGLLAENAALQREVRQLRQQLEQLRQTRPPDVGCRVSNGAAPTITPQLVERWGQAMARHPGWLGLRIGPPGGLRGLVLGTQPGTVTSAFLFQMANSPCHDLLG
jgi:hypothetical protein